MQHLFSSGEILYNKNQKELKEGLFTGELLEYPDEVQPDTWYICKGTLDGKDTELRFTVHQDEYEGIASRLRFGILMQSDIFQARWSQYVISK